MTWSRDSQIAAIDSFAKTLFRVYPDLRLKITNEDSDIVEVAVQFAPHDFKVIAKLEWPFNIRSVALHRNEYLRTIGREDLMRDVEGNPIKEDEKPGPDRYLKLVLRPKEIYVDRGRTARTTYRLTFITGIEAQPQMFLRELDSKEEMDKLINMWCTALGGIPVRTFKTTPTLLWNEKEIE